MIRTGKELAAAAIAAAQNFKTLYVMGCFGAPMTASNQRRYCNNHAYNARKDRTEKIMAASADTFGFDCVCLIKGLLWGWEGNESHVYGGAAYRSNGVPDKGADQMIALCHDVSRDFGILAVGETVWLPGHIGIYVGGGKVVECTPEWDDGVQLVPLSRRSWVSHGKLPYVTYAETDISTRVELPMLRNGDKGGIVRALQALLIGCGYSCGHWRADGIFGNGTENALMHYQDDHDLEIDGICGSESWKSLLGVEA